MKTPIALRIDPEILAAARECARQDNRTLTNFIETALRQRIAEKTSALVARGRDCTQQIRERPRDL
ncbi:MULTISPECIES: YlcI/YnfO family protein [unclassified Methylobacterium]|uniref:YlcI/YnfO family protein n=1 Tax=unclassified Methylobacterium TaxID=2615210 RepID=UPI001FB8EA76|nr:MULTISPECIES: YlcI/YnfO family protein [unclassified Methylobacterium]MCJ2092070.1 hypothetical protein [Methylobacterium sp. J-072]MCJ2139748.1 hypothetical protein [Methylobacterium sp. E-066]